MPCRSLTVLLVTTAIFAPAPALAAARCQTSVSPMSFAAMAMFTGSPDRDSTAAVDFNCTDDGLPPTPPADVSYTIALSAGSGASFLPRSMSGTGDALEYNLYLDPNRSAVWGDGTNATVTASGNFPVPGGNSHLVYGRIPGGQTGVGRGLYADSVTVTVEY